uniref:IS66 family transposase n=1 Tax=Falsigemmobacter intermedius TaxID=1553448 RepID=UPI001F4F9144|nr:IS66 family transposase [Falsigemmobacter intermedius]
MAGKKGQKKRVWSDDEKLSICAQARVYGVSVAQIAQLYAVVKEARGKSPEERVALRQAKAKPVFDALELWLQTQLRKISGKTKLAEAIRYALNRMPKARGYLSDGQLELDNNTCERSIRPIALGIGVALTGQLAQV